MVLAGVGIFDNWESESLLVTFRGLLTTVTEGLSQFQRGSVSFREDLDSGLHFCALGTRPHTGGLG